MKKEERKLQFKIKKEKKELEKQKKRMLNQISINREKKKELKDCEEKIDELLKVMKISDMMMIERAYEDLK